MKYFLDGEAVEFEDTFDVSRLPDRLQIRTAEGSFSALAVRDGDAVLVSFKGNQYRLETRQSRTRSGGAKSGEYRAPMPGMIVDVLVSEGDAVVAGQKILVLEAMKTQQPFNAPFDGVVSTLHAVKGTQVSGEDLLAVVTPS
ncbi:MAG: acetyl-CoA carboxylase biotin carboxyl carrier protein subunit [Armatimonadota bacterium]